jgi:hypothetical protein
VHHGKEMRHLIERHQNQNKLVKTKSLPVRKRSIPKKKHKKKCPASRALTYIVSRAPSMI